jgi:hypothetical protein
MLRNVSDDKKSITQVTTDSKPLINPTNITSLGSKYAALVCKINADQPDRIVVIFDKLNHEIVSKIACDYWSFSDRPMNDNIPRIISANDDEHIAILQGVNRDQERVRVYSIKNPDKPVQFCLLDRMPFTSMSARYYAIFSSALLMHLLYFNSLNSLVLRPIQEGSPQLASYTDGKTLPLPTEILLSEDREYFIGGRLQSADKNKLCVWNVNQTTKPVGYIDLPLGCQVEQLTPVATPHQLLAANPVNGDVYLLDLNASKVIAEYKNPRAGTSVKSIMSMQNGCHFIVQYNNNETVQWAFDTRVASINLSPTLSLTSSVACDNFYLDQKDSLNVVKFNEGVISKPKASLIKDRKSSINEYLYEGIQMLHVLNPIILDYLDSKIELIIPDSMKIQVVNRMISKLLFSKENRLAFFSHASGDAVEDSEASQALIQNKMTS